MIIFIIIGERKIVYGSYFSPLKMKRIKYYKIQGKYNLQLAKCQRILAVIEYFFQSHENLFEGVNPFRLQIPHGFTFDCDRFVENTGDLF